jgi:hypothetical protein
VAAHQQLMDRLPLAIVIDNNEKAHPAYGLDRAELVYEIVAEGGITRFLAVYWRNDVGTIMPVRSARVYFLPWTLELDAVFVHYGGAQEPAVANIYGWIPAYGVHNIDGLVLPRGPFQRESSRRAPHNVFASTAGLWDLATAREWTGPPALALWLFKEDEPGGSPPEDAERASAVFLSFGPWSKAPYNVQWQYDALRNTYRRLQGGKSQRDAASGQQITAKNIVVQFVGLSYAGDGVHLLFETEGEGDAIVFQDGLAIPANWRKTDREARTRFYDALGNEIAFNRGATWVEVLANGSPVLY